MSELSRLQKLKDQGFEIDPQRLKVADRKDRKTNRPEPKKLDPLAATTKELVEMAGKSDATLAVMTKQLIEVAEKSDATMELVLKTLGEMLKTISVINRDASAVKMPEPKLKEWKFKAVRIDSNTVNIKAKQIK